MKKLFNGNYKDDFEIVNVGGKDNLSKVKNVFRQNTNEGGKNLLIFDADITGVDNGGCQARQAYLNQRKSELGIEFEMFLFPNNQDDGEFETLLERIVRKDIHEDYFNCFDAFENCMRSHKDNEGVERYNAPNLKGKLYTLMTSVKLSKSKRDGLGSGKWLFEDNNYWDMDSVELDKLKEFIRSIKI